MEKGKIKIIILLVVAFLIGFAANFLMSEIEGEKDGVIEVPYSLTINPNDFVDKVDNQYFPLIEGRTLIYEGETEDGTERIESYVTNQTRVVMGVTCVVVRETETINGVLAEDTYDWYAQDKYGNVWYFGEDTKEYEDGEFKTSAGSWEAGIDGALPGVIMLADPVVVGLTYRQEYYQGEAEDMGAVLKLNQSETVSYGSFDNVLITMDWTPLEPDVTEHKYYAPGIGVILEVEVKGGSDRIELIDIITD